MCDQEPEAKDRLGKNIKNGIGHNLRVHRQDAASITKTPDDRIKSPENQSEASNSSEECSSLGVLCSSGLATSNCKDPYNHDVGNTSHSIVSPLLSPRCAKGSEESGEHHDDISNNSDENIGTVYASKEAEIEEKKWGGDTPVDVTCPQDLTVDSLSKVWTTFNGGLILDGSIGFAVAGSHGEVGNCGKESDAGSKNVEQSLLLGASQ